MVAKGKDESGLTEVEKRVLAWIRHERVLSLVNAHLGDSNASRKARAACKEIGYGATTISRAMRTLVDRGLAVQEHNRRVWFYVTPAERRKIAAKRQSVQRRIEAEEMALQHVAQYGVTIERSSPSMAQLPIEHVIKLSKLLDDLTSNQAG